MAVMADESVRSPSHLAGVGVFDLYPTWPTSLLATNSQQSFTTTFRIYSPSSVTFLKNNISARSDETLFIEVEWTDI